MFKIVRFFTNNFKYDKNHIPIFFLSFYLNEIKVYDSLNCKSFMNT